MREWFEHYAKRNADQHEFYHAKPGYLLKSGMESAGVYALTNDLMTHGGEQVRKMPEGHGNFTEWAKGQGRFPGIWKLTAGTFWDFTHSEQESKKQNSYL